MYTCSLENSKVKTRPLDVYITLVICNGSHYNKARIDDSVLLILCAKRDLWVESGSIHIETGG